MRYKGILAAALTLLTTACSTQRTATEASSRDSVSISTLHTNTEAARATSDSTHVRDSVFVMVKGDTIYIYKERARYRDRIRTDTIRCTETRTDTVCITRTITISEKAKATNTKRIVATILITGVIGAAIWWLQKWRART